MYLSSVAYAETHNAPGPRESEKLQSSADVSFAPQITQSAQSEGLSSILCRAAACTTSFFAGGRLGERPRASDGFRWDLLHRSSRRVG